MRTITQLIKEEATTPYKCLHQKAIEVAAAYNERNKNVKYKAVKIDARTTLLQKIK